MLRRYRLYFLTNAAHFLSGEIDSHFWASACASFAHVYFERSHAHSAPTASKWIEAPSFTNSKLSKGSLPGGYVFPATRESSAASLAWSNAGTRVLASASTSRNCFPSGPSWRYQNREVFSIQCGVTSASATR